MKILKPHNAELILYQSWRPKGFFQFEIIINGLVISFWFIWIPILWVYDHKKYFTGETVFIRQNLTYKYGPRAVRVKDPCESCKSLIDQAS